MIVYIVREWEAYEGFEIVGVYADEGKAHEVAAEIERKRGVEGWHGASVSSYEVQ